MNSIILCILSGFFYGTWPITLKLAKSSKFENFWFSLTTFVLFFTFLYTLSTTSIIKISEELRSGSLITYSWALIGGMLWGVGSLTYGKGIKLLGLASASALIMGLAMCFGTFIPMFMMGGIKQASKTAYLYGISGTLSSVVGVGIGAIAIRARSEEKTEKKIFKGLIVCIISGLGSSFFSLAFAGSACSKQGCFTPWISTSLITLGFWMSQTLYLIPKILKQKSLKDFKKLRVHLLLPFLGGILFALGTITDFASAGKVGIALAYPLMMNLIVFFSNLWSLTIFREWKGASKKAYSLQILSLIILMIASTLIGQAMS